MLVCALPMPNYVIECEIRCAMAMLPGITGLSIRNNVGACMRRPTVSAGLVSGLVAYAHARGCEPGALTAATGIDLSRLDDPDSRLPLAAYLQLFDVAAKMLDDPALALRHGEAVGMSQISIVGLLMEASKTIGDAFLQMRRFGQLATQIDAVSDRPRFEMRQEAGRLFLVDNLPPTAPFRPLIESGFAWLACGPRRYMNRAPVIRVELVWPAPAHADIYEAVLRCPVTFGADRNALEMPPDALSWPVARNPHYVFSMLTRRAETLLDALNETGSVAGRLRALMAAELHTGTLSADQCARALGMSRQTLYRRLKVEGHSYRGVLDALRLQLAREYLEGGRTALAEIAYLTGFADPAAFTKAFNRWTGLSPGAFRDRNRRQTLS